ncbi:uncharacterized protein UHOD_11874 [Ustilago sp. UG-2017b]|nr:uncharacterized protein UHOD_11874 [Ustilago sp. UG-2017b]
MASAILLVLLLFFSLCRSSSLTQSCSSGSWSLEIARHNQYQYSGWGSTRPLMARRYGYIHLRSFASDTAPALSPESTLFAEHCTGVPDEAPPPHRALLAYRSCLP